MARNDVENSVVVNFHGWQTPNVEWARWREHLRPNYEEIWRTAGILEAINATSYRIHCNSNIIMGLARKWRPETNTFLFQWGEASITLDDVSVLGGFSVTGDRLSIDVPPDSDFSRVNERLMEARKVINKLPTRKCTYHHWLRHFTNTGNGFGDVEHEAFLVYWLSRFVFPKVRDTVGKMVHWAAIQLARGSRLALAPAILASIYVDLGRISNSIPIDLNRSGNEVIHSWSPRHLVQAWAWERFPLLRPNPNPIPVGEPTLARWRDVRPLEVSDRMVLEAGSDFQWRPYPLHENLNIFIGHEVVGLEGSIEPYQPHRVAMQFGMDQDDM